MNYKTREHLFNKIMVNTRKLLYFLFRLDKHKKFKPFRDVNDYIPVLSVNPEQNLYRFNCYCLECPVNENGLCRTKFYQLPLKNVYILHEFDGDNIVRNYCG